MITKEMVLPVGKIFKPHGYKGELNIQTDFESSLFEKSHTPFFIMLDNILVPFFVESIGGGVRNTSFIKFKGINSDLAAAEFANHELFALKSSVSEITGVSIEELESEIRGVMGYKVYNGSLEHPIGSVVELEDGIEYDYLIVKNAKSDEEVTIPFVDEFVTEINEEADGNEGYIIVNLPEGFMEI